jgi:superfamily II RNA helicase
MQKITRNLLKLQRDNSVEISVNTNPLLAGLIQLWCKEETKWEDLLRLTNLDEGDIVRASRRTIDLLRHIKNAPYLDSKIITLAKNAFELMDKEPVKEVV